MGNRLTEEHRPPSTQENTERRGRLFPQRDSILMFQRSTYYQIPDRTGWSSGNATDLHSGGAGFHSRTGHRLS
jgi:hypothetical protein